MAALVSIPVLGVALILQTSILSRISLLSGNADLILLLLAGLGLYTNSRKIWIWAFVAGVMVGFVSGLPMVVPLAGYLATMGLARLMYRRVWQAPLMAMFVITFGGTFILFGLSYVALWLKGPSLPLWTSFSQIFIPSVLLNLFLSIPMLPILRDLNHLLYPEKEED